MDYVIDRVYFIVAFVCLLIPFILSHLRAQFRTVISTCKSKFHPVNYNYEVLLLYSNVSCFFLLPIISLYK